MAEIEFTQSFKIFKMIKKSYFKFSFITKKLLHNFQKKYLRY